MAEGAGYGQKISHSEYSTFKRNLNEINGQLVQNVRQLQALIGTVSVGWQGAGASAFQKAQNAINNDHHAMNQMLSGIIEAVHNTQKLGVGNDEDILNSFRQIDVNGSAAGGHISAGSGLGGIDAGLDQSGAGKADFNGSQVGVDRSKLSGL
ncbi:WXG100 family type VII secretion target [Streptomyces spirodelae]|uniref:WXG100 family type VII secretion target n=1 Tax=Streptomyces spirodelae TaxID=2812904 RepID=A0ABS3X3H1_9ACTN|nr:WXG100 family type VII secretion target [Streptomyces spirodelae]MBO8189652.1 WXG100 family type VII secretion target [Streptomyces spirodelae]